MFTADGIEEITLIFVIVQTPDQLPLAINFTTLHIMAGGDVICAEGFGSKLEKGFEFNLFIAHDVGIRCAAGFILR